MMEALAPWFIFNNYQMIDVALLILRVFIGVCFIIHGLGKLGIVGTGNMAGFVGWLKSLNVPFAEIQGRMAMATEIGAGLMITFGIFHRVGCLFSFITMVVAALIGHKGGGYLITNSPPGNEYTVNLAAVVAALFLTGPGQYSLDFLIFAN
jgi:putative oxidoreductase